MVILNKIKSQFEGRFYQKMIKIGYSLVCSGLSKLLCSYIHTYTIYWWIVLMGSLNKEYLHRKSWFTYMRINNSEV